MSLDLSAIQGSDELIAMVMTCASTWMEAALSDPGAGQRWVVYDEAWRLMRQPALLARMQAQWKLSRGLGIANLMIVQRLSDLDAVGDADSQSRNLARGLLGDCSPPSPISRNTANRREPQPSSASPPSNATSFPTSSKAKVSGASAAVPSSSATSPLRPKGQHSKQGSGWVLPKQALVGRIRQR